MRIATRAEILTCNFTCKSFGLGVLTRTWAAIDALEVVGST
jgi:hypothetical protein